MGKQIIYTCDVCGVQVEDNPVSNVAVSLNSSGSINGLSAGFDAFVCADCAIKKSMPEILVGVSDAAKKEKKMIAVASITLKAVNDNGTIKGIPVKQSAVQLSINSQCLSPFDHKENIRRPHKAVSPTDFNT
jgi:hypothetical protein